MAMASGLKPVALFTLISLHSSRNLDQTTLVKKRFIIWRRERFFPWTKEANPPVQERSILPTWI